MTYPEKKLQDFVDKQAEWISSVIDNDLDNILSQDQEIIKVLTKGLDKKSTLITYCVFLLENSIYDNFRTEFNTQVVPNDLHFPILRKILEHKDKIEGVIEKYL